MGRTLYFDCFSGISGDKTLGALVDLGVPLEEIRSGLSRLPLPGWEIAAVEVERNWMRGTQVTVEVSGDPGHRGRSEILRVLEAGSLPEGAAERAGRMFERILTEEARIHGIDIEKVHLHEVGAVDAIVDIVGTAIAIELLQPERIVCSPINVGSGSVKTEHGLLPVPAPATAELLRGAPVLAAGPEFELTTPTGAVIATTLADDWGPLPPLTISRIGYGAGSKDFPGFPNLLRVVEGDAGDQAGCGTIEIESNVDDCSPNVLAHAMERMFTAGALDVWFQPIQMKKNRPAVLISAIVADDRLEAVADALFSETTSIGLRYRRVERITLDRRFQTVTTPWGEVTIKIASRGGRVLQASPEFEEAKALALQHGVAVARVLEAALAVYRESDPCS